MIYSMFVYSILVIIMRVVLAVIAKIALNYNLKRTLLVFLGGICILVMIYLGGFVVRSAEVKRDSLLYIISIFIAFMVVGGSIGMVPYIFLMYSMLYETFYINTLEHFMFTPYVMTLAVVIPQSILFLAVIEFGIGWNAIKFDTYRWSQSRAMAIAVALAVLLAILFFIAEIISANIYNGDHREFGNLFKDYTTRVLLFTNPIGFAAFFVAATVIGPIFEETYFRGYMFAMLLKNHNKFWAYIITALIFAMVHLSFVNLPSLILAALILCWIYDKYGLKYSIIMHGVYNAAFLAFYWIYSPSL